MPSLYAELGVTPSAPLDVLRLAFKRRALIVHPDKGGTKEAFQRVMLAFEVLSDASSRQRYDRRLASFPCPGRPKGSCRTSAKAAATKATIPRQHGTQKFRCHRTETPAHGNARCGATHVSPPREEGSQVFSRGRAAQAATKPPTPPVSKVAAAAEAGDSNTQAEQQKPPMHTERRFRRQRHNVLLERLVQTLHALPPLNRREALHGLFTAGQRQRLEAFMLAGKAQKQKPYTQPSSSVLCEQIDDIDSSFESNTSDSEEADSDGENACIVVQREPLPCSSCSNCGSKEGMDETLALCDLVSAEAAEDVMTDCGQSGLGSTEAVEDVLVADAGTSTQSESRAGSSWSRSSIRGLYAFRTGPNAGKYCVGVGLGALLMTTRRVRDLSVALDHLVVLTEMKQHVKASMASTAGARVCEAHSLTVAKWGHAKFTDMGLSFNVQLYNNFWIGHVPMRTPCMHTISHVVEALDALAPYIGNFVGGHYTISQAGLVELEKQWEEFKRVFSGLSGKLGHCTEHVVATLAKLEESHRPSRERQGAFWNQRQMAAEERLHLQLLKWERRVERRNRAIMARHDRLSQRAGSKHTMHVELLVRRIETLVPRWWKLESRIVARDRQKVLRKRAIEERCSLRDRRIAARAAFVASRVAARKARASRDARWRAMHRPDLTMADILERRWEPADKS